MVKKVSILIGCAAFMIVFFQNCGKAPSVTSNSSETSGVAGLTTNQPQYNSYAISNVSKVSIWDEEKQRFIQIDLDTGDALAMERAGEVPGEKILVTNVELADLKSILSQADVCDPIKKENSEGKMCSQNYEYPYAKFHGKSQEISLGEKVNSCSVPVDLCGEKASQLKKWSIDFIKAL